MTNNNQNAATDQHLARTESEAVESTSSTAEMMEAERSRADSSSAKRSFVELKPVNASPAEAGGAEYRAARDGVETAVYTDVATGNVRSSMATIIGGSAKGEKAQQRRRCPRLTRQEISERLEDCVAALGHTPTNPEFERVTGITKWQINQLFGSWKQALRASGRKPQREARARGLDMLFQDWAEVVREVKKIPSVKEYLRRMSSTGFYSLKHRFTGWKRVPEGMLDFILKEGIQDKWRDVMEIIEQHLGLRKGTAGGIVAQPGRTPGGEWKGIFEDRPVYGPPLGKREMISAPTSEAGVLVLLGMMAQELGFHVMKAQSAFPDCEVLYEVAPGKWQMIRVEVEYLSSNFLMHGHDPAGCDMIVCWVHNWPECPLRVLELSKFF